MNKNRNEAMGVAIDDEQLDQIAGGDLLEEILCYLIKTGRDLLTKEFEN